MKHSMELKTASIFTEKLAFNDPLTNTNTELTCDWSLNAGVLTPTGPYIADQLTAMGFDSAVTDAYRKIYSDTNIQSLVMMMFGGVN